MNNRLEAIAESYDRGLEVSPYENLPEEILKHPDYQAYRAFAEEAGPVTGGDSGFGDIRAYLDPAAGMRFIDLGCSANLIINGYDAWPSLYHGVDISSKTIELLKRFTTKHELAVGALICGSIHETPFEDSTFDIGACIGVLEYYTKDFVETALREMHRIMKPGGKLVLDAPNLESAACRGMMLLEANAGRPDLFDLLPPDFETMLCRYFEIEKAAKADAWPMYQYFLRCKK
jgi:ubiquinone/menaquinone biosynthesis C-methylase UbiE